MNHFFLRTGVAIACALGLASCGGGEDGQLRIGVSLVNVTKAGLKLQNNGGTFYDVTPGSAFIFPDLIPLDGSFDVVAQGLPPNASKCEVLNGKAKATSVSLQKIQVVCTLYTFNLGGSVSGLSADGLVLVNGNIQKAIPKDATSFNLTVDPGNGGTVTGKIAEGLPYAVQIFASPANLNCTISNNSGTMPAADVASIAVSCVPKP